MGGFSEEALTKFNDLCNSSLSFTEEQTYDFVRCITPEGEIYGSATQCKAGKPLPENKGGGENGAAGGKGNIRKLAKLTRMFRIRNGRDMTTAQLSQAAQRIGVPIPQGKTAEEFLKELLPPGEKVIPVKSA